MTILQDVRYGARVLAKSKSFTAAAVLTLAVGIGGNTAVFSLVDAVVLRPLPYRDPDRLVALSERRADGTHPISGHEFAAWRDRQTVFDGIAAYLYVSLTATGGGDAEALDARLVSAGYFDVLGVAPRLGRTFHPGEDRAGANRVAILSHRLWQRRYGAAPSVLGRSIVLDGVPHEIVGVMDRRGDLDPDIWVPMDLPQELRRVGRHSSFAIARLAGGVTLDRVRADLDTIARQVEREFPGASTGHRVAVVPLHDALVGAVERPAWVALGAVAFVLLIACTNVAHLLLTRAASRRREMALRAALGASRWALIRQALVESLLLALLGGAAGLLLAAWIVDLLPTLVRGVPRIADMRIDGRALAATGLISLLAGLIAGIAPALRGIRLDLRSRMQDGLQATSAPPARLAAALVASEIALALVLLVGSGLMIRSFVRLARVDPGFTSRSVLVVPVSLPGVRYAPPQQRIAAIDAIVERVGGLPGVRAVGATSQLPLAPGENWTPIAFEGRPPAAPGQEVRVLLRTVAAGYFEALGIPLRAGRRFVSGDARVALPLIRWFPQQQPYPRHDEPQAAPVALVNETAARRFWPGGQALAKRVRLLWSDPITIVGIVGDVRHAALAAPPQPEIYLSHAQEPPAMLTLAVRTDGDPMAVAPAVREQIRTVDRDLPVAVMRRMESVVSESVGQARFETVLLGTFGAVALALAVVGIYGLTSYAVAQRTREIGIRTALGASGHDVLRLVLGRSLALTGLGIAGGLAGAGALTSVLANLLFEIEPTDPATFASVTLLLAAAALLASYVPARRALRADPLVVLRAE